jgi:Tfp pilus assembly protein PilX
MTAPIPPRAVLALRRRGERGSAFLIVLFVLVLLTAFGLSLALITGTESQIGAVERATTRNLYAADSGLHQSLTRAQTTNRVNSVTQDLSTSTVGSLQLANRVQISAFAPLVDSPCNLCAINEGNKYIEVSFVVTATARRTATTGSDTEETALKTLSVLWDRQPVPEAGVRVPEELYNPSDPAPRRLIRY